MCIHMFICCQCVLRVCGCQSTVAFSGNKRKQIEEIPTKNPNFGDFKFLAMCVICMQKKSFLSNRISTIALRQRRPSSVAEEIFLGRVDTKVFCVFGAFLFVFKESSAPHPPHPHPNNQCSPLLFCGVFAASTENKIVQTLQMWVNFANANHRTYAHTHHIVCG